MLPAARCTNSVHTEQLGVAAAIADSKGKKGKKKKKNVGVGDTGAARLNEEMLCS